MSSNGGSSVSFGVPVGQLSYEGARAVAAAADQAGFDHLSVSDRPHDPLLDGWVLATALAVQTSRVRFYHSTLNIPFRYPATAAKEAASFDILSNGRLDLCLGAGGEGNRPLYDAVGVPLPQPGERLRRLRETIEICRGLWANEKFSYAGRHYRLEDAVGAPQPVQQPIPIWIGAGAPRSLALAGQLADGYVKNGGWGSLEVMTDYNRQVSEAASAAGRDPNSIRCLMQCACYLATDEAAAAAFRERTAAPPAGVPAFQMQGITGTRDQLLKELRDYRAAGVDTFVLRFPADQAIEQIARFAAEVMPEARGL